MNYFKINSFLILLYSNILRGKYSSAASKQISISTSQNIPKISRGKTAEVSNFLPDYDPPPKIEHFTSLPPSKAGAVVVS